MVCFFFFLYIWQVVANLFLQHLRHFDAPSCLSRYVVLYGVEVVEYLARDFLQWGGLALALVGIVVHHYLDALWHEIDIHVGPCHDRLAIIVYRAF